MGTGGGSLISVPLQPRPPPTPHPVTVDRVNIVTGQLDVSMFYKGVWSSKALPSLPSPRSPGLGSGYGYFQYVLSGISLISRGSAFISVS